MTDYKPTANVPPWDGTPREAFEVWRLSKDGRHTVCAVWTHPIGAEARVSVDGELRRSEAKRDVMALVIAALDWKAQFQEKGWK